MIKIVVIDDDELILSGLKTFLELKNYQVETAGTAMAGLAAIKRTVPHIVFLDLGLPNISGLELLVPIRQFDKTIRVIVISAVGDEETIAKTRRLGASDYVVKPFSMASLSNDVMGKIFSQTIEHRRKTVLQIVYAFATAIEAKNKFLKGHSEAVARYASMIVEEIKDEKKWAWVRDKGALLENGSLLHDIGKMGIRDEILDKPGKLTPEEYEVIKRHPVIGYNIVSQLEDLEEYSDIILYHHERWDGGGYPKGKESNDIPAAARIVSVADSYDAMTSNRAYRNALSKDEAVRKLEQGKEGQFDPVVVEAFVHAVRKVAREKEYSG